MASGIKKLPTIWAMSQRSFGFFSSLPTRPSSFAYCSSVMVIANSMFGVARHPSSVASGRLNLRLVRSGYDNISTGQGPAVTRILVEVWELSAFHRALACSSHAIDGDRGRNRNPGARSGRRGPQEGLEDG